MIIRFTVGADLVSDRVKTLKLRWFVYRMGNPVWLPCMGRHKVCPYSCNLLRFAIVMIGFNNNVHIGNEFGKHRRKHRNKHRRKRHFGLVVWAQRATPCPMNI